MPALSTAAGAVAGVLVLDALGWGISNDMRFGRALAEFQLATLPYRIRGATMADVWEGTVRGRPGSEALVVDDAVFTFGRLDAAVNCAAAVLARTGWRRGDTVAVMMVNSPAFIATWLALAKLGVAVAFINTNLRSSQLVHSIVVAKPAGVVVDAECTRALHDALPAIHTRLAAEGGGSSGTGSATLAVLRWVDTSLAGYSSVGTVVRGAGGSNGGSGKVGGGSGSGSTAAAAAAASTAPTRGRAGIGFTFEDGPPVEVLMAGVAPAPARVPPPPRSARAGMGMQSVWGYIYTSGTTGLPKPAVITHLRYFMAGHMMAGVAGITPADRVYCALPLYHSAGGMIGIGMMITRGVTVVLAKKFSARGWWADVNRSRATVVQYIGELCRYLVAAPPQPGERTHAVRLALGNGLRPDVWAKFQDRFGIPAVAEFYASTEGNATLVNLCTTPEDRGAVGRYGTIARALGIFRLAKYDDDKGA